MSADFLSHISSDPEIIQVNEKFGFRILLYKPEQANYQLLVTDGLRKTAQEVNSDNEDLKHIELYFCLPEYWNIENAEWPVYWLNRIAEVPQKFKTWFGHGDTLPAGKPAEEVADNFAANHFMLSRPIHLKEVLTQNESQAFLGIIPLFQKEMDYKLKNSHTLLLNKFESKNINERLDIYRENTCKKKFGIF